MPFYMSDDFFEEGIVVQCPKMDETEESQKEHPGELYRCRMQVGHEGYCYDGCRE